MVEIFAIFYFIHALKYFKIFILTVHLFKLTNLRMYYIFEAKSIVYILFYICTRHY